MINAEFKQKGYCIGSGVIEAGCKTIIGKRDLNPVPGLKPRAADGDMSKPGLKGRLGHAAKHGGSPAGSRGRTFAPLRPWEGSRYPAARMASYGVAAVFRPPKKEYSRISSNKYKSASREGCKNPSLHKSREIRRRRVNETKA